MRRVLFMISLAIGCFSCNNSGENKTAADSSATNSTIQTDTNNASTNTGVDMSGGVNSGKNLRGDSSQITDTGSGQH